MVISTVFSYVKEHMKNYRNTLFLLDEQLIQKYSESAIAYSKYLDKSLMFVYSSGRNASCSVYEVFFGEENFMHLTGCTAQKKNENEEVIQAKYGAVEFYRHCLNNNITFDDILFKHNKETSRQKAYILPRLLDFANSKFYKIGKHDKINLYNDFEVAIGFQKGILGCGHWNTQITHAIPVTVLPNSISEYTSSPCKILYVLQNDGYDSENNATKYSKLLFEIKKGLFFGEANKCLSKEVLEKIDNSLFRQT